MMDGVKKMSELFLNKAVKEQKQNFASMCDQQEIEKQLYETFTNLPDQALPNSDDYYSVVNHQLYRYILKHYKHGEKDICFWRFFKTISKDQLEYKTEANPELNLLDYFVRIFFCSQPLDDLTCIFTPIGDRDRIKKYLQWIDSYFYDVNYPTSILWLYALDSSLASLFPDEIIFLGKRRENPDSDMIVPDFTYRDSILIKRFNETPPCYTIVSGTDALTEFRQTFTFLQREYVDRCLSCSVDQNKLMDLALQTSEWEKFEDVLRFGVSDDIESGCVSFSDMRASTEFLNTFGKTIFLNKIQQPFFEKTKLVNQYYKGRIDKFMGDNVMCVFLTNNMQGKHFEEKEKQAILNHFFALFDLARVLLEVCVESNLVDSKLGLRSGVTYGNKILRSNLGNEIVRDFTVTGQTVNLAARLEHISIRELIAHNSIYFEKCIQRFPQVSELITIEGNYDNLNPETRTIIKDFTIYQNICSNLEKLEKVRFDIRFNDLFYLKLREHLISRGYAPLNNEKSETHGYEEFNVEGFSLKFYFSFYNPKGFRQFEKIWILPLEFATLAEFKVEKLL